MGDAEDIAEAREAYMAYREHLAQISQPQEKQQIPQASLGPKESSVEHFGNALTLGYLPQLQAATAPAIYGVMNKLTGNDIQPESYVNERDANIKRLQNAEKENPKSSLAGNVAGSVVGSLATPLPKLGVLGKGLLGQIARGGAYGAAYGAASNPGDTEGQVDPAQLQERKQNAIHGSEIGSVTGFGTGLVSKGLGALERSGNSARQSAAEQAVRASGGMLKDFRELNGKDSVEKIGNFALDKGLVQAGDTFEDVEMKANALRKDAGQRLNQIYESSKGLVDESKFRGFNPARDKEAILNSISESMGDDPGKMSALGKIQRYLNQLERDHGDALLDPKTANDIKSTLDREINYARNPLNKKPSLEKAYSSMRDYVSERVSEHIEDFGKYSGNPKVTEQLAEANKDYGFSKKIQQMAEDKTNRELSNRMFGLTDTIAGGAGAGVGALAGQVVGGNDLKHTSEGAIIGGLLSGMLNKAGRKYGPGVLATSSKNAAPILDYTTSPVGKFGGIIKPDIATKAILQSNLSKKKNKG